MDCNPKNICLCEACDYCLAYFLAQRVRLKLFLLMTTIVIHSASSEFRALVCGLLSGIEALLIPVASRKELFGLCRTTKCDLVLTDDVRMFMNGSDALDLIRQGGALPQIFILSNDLTEDTVTALLEVGINQFITLPVAPERLREKVVARSKTI